MHHATGASHVAASPSRLGSRSRALKRRERGGRSARPAPTARRRRPGCRALGQVAQQDFADAAVGSSDRNVHAPTDLPFRSGPWLPASSEVER